MPVGELTPASELRFSVRWRRASTRARQLASPGPGGDSSRRKTEHARVSPLAFLARVRFPPRFGILELGRGAPANADVAVGNPGLNLVGEILPLGV
jgi:hypothetical protein